jgi:hypothetical protein
MPRIPTLKPTHYLAAFVRCIGCAALFGIAYYLLNKPMAVRMALPIRTVVGMQEYYQDAAPLPDFIHCVKAEITEPEFKLFVAQMQLVPYRGTQSFPSCDLKWWSASEDSSISFYRAGDEVDPHIMVKFENGSLYYWASDS